MGNTIFFCLLCSSGNVRMVDSGFFTVQRQLLPRLRVGGFRDCIERLEKQPRMSGFQSGRPQCLSDALQLVPPELSQQRQRRRGKHQASRKPVHRRKRRTVWKVGALCPRERLLRCPPTGRRFATARTAPMRQPVLRGSAIRRRQELLLLVALTASGDVICDSGNRGPI